MPPLLFLTAIAIGQVVGQEIDHRAVPVSLLVEHDEVDHHLAIGFRRDCRPDMRAAILAEIPGRVVQTIESLDRVHLWLDDPNDLDAVIRELWGKDGVGHAAPNPLLVTDERNLVVPGMVIVRLRPGATTEVRTRLLERHALKVVREGRSPLCRLPQGARLGPTIADLQREAAVEYACASHVDRVLS